MKRFNYFKIALLGSVLLLLVAIVYSYTLTRFTPLSRSAGKNTDIVTGEQSLSTTKERPFSHPYIIRADSLFAAGNFEMAGSHYKQSARAFNKEKNWKGYVWALNQQALCLIKTNQLQPSYDLLTSALKTAERELGKDHAYAGKTFYTLGEYYYAMGDGKPALESLQTSLYLAKRSFGPDSKLVIDAYKLIGRIYWRIIFDYNKAENYLDSASILFDESKLKDPAFECGLYYDFGAANYYKGDYDKGMKYSYGCLKIAESMQNAGFMEKAHSLIANFYSAISDVNNNIYHLQLAVALNKKSKWKSDLINYYNNLGNAYLSIKKYEQAKKLYKDALESIFSVPYPDSLEISNSYAAMADVYQQLGNFDTSLYYYQKCLGIRQTYYGKNHFKTALALRGIGVLYEHFNLPDSALAYFNAAIWTELPELHKPGVNVEPSIANIGNRLYLFEVISDKALALQHQYTKYKHLPTLYQALANYQLADTLMHLYARSYDQVASKLLLNQKLQRIYEKALECTWLLAGVTKDDYFKSYAFHLMERSKNQLLLQSLRQAESLNATGVPDSLITEEKNLQMASDSYQQQLDRISGADSAKPGAIDNIRSGLFEIEKKQEKLKKTLRNQYPAFFKFKYTDEKLTLPDMQEWARENHSQMIEYFWGDSVVYLVSITENKSEFTRVPLTKKLTGDLESYIGHFTESRRATLPADRIKYNQKELENYVQRAYTLYDNLLKSVLPASLPDNTGKSPGHKLVIIPDGPLAYLPFHALISRMPSSGEASYKNLDYLLNDFQVSTAYSASLLVRGKDENAIKAKNTILGFGYSTSSPIASHQNNELPGAGRELQEVSKVFDGKYLVGEDATKKNFIKYAPGYNILHLAIHGKTNEKNHYESSLLFKRAEADSSDASLYSYELYGFKLSARLVVLSACETGSGKLYKGEGVYSMARAFAYAGCPSLVMSLWKVDDNTTADLMQGFYKHLARGLHIDESLRLAQLQYLGSEDELKCDPKFWAAFTPLGNMSPVNSGYSQTSLLTGVFSLALLVFVYIVRKRKLQNKNVNGETPVVLSF